MAAHKSLQSQRLATPTQRVANPVARFASVLCRRAAARLQRGRLQSAHATPRRSRDAVASLFIPQRTGSIPVSPARVSSLTEQMWRTMGISKWQPADPIWRSGDHALTQIPIPHEPLYWLTDEPEWRPADPIW